MRCPSVSCPHCSGTGKTKLSAVHAETLALVGKEWISTTDILPKLPGASWIKLAAVCNRMTKLHELGLVEFERRGKAKFWRRK